MSNRGSQSEISFKNVQLVLEREDVQNGIREIRKKWKIPANGFTKIGYRKWTTGLTQKFIFASEDLSPSEYSLFLDDISKLRKGLKPKLPLYWEVFFRIYVPTGEIKEKLNTRSRTYNTPSINIVPNYREEKIRLEFGANTRLNDIRIIWDKIKKLQRTMPEYDPTRRRRTLNRDILLFRESRIGKKPKKIFNELPLSENPDDDLTIQTVSKAIQRMKKITKRQ